MFRVPGVSGRHGLLSMFGAVGMLCLTQFGCDTVFGEGYYSDNLWCSGVGLILAGGVVAALHRDSLDHNGRPVAGWPPHRAVYELYARAHAGPVGRLQMFCFLPIRVAGLVMVAIGSTLIAADIIH